MAESVVSSVVQSLSNLLIQEVVFLKGVREQVEWIRDELQRMQCFLKDADAKQEDDSRVKNWVSEIRNAAYDAEDIIDTVMLKIESQNNKDFVRRCAYIFKEPIDLYMVGKKIESLKDRLNDISRSCVRYNISFGEGMRSNARENLRQLRRSSPRGLEKDLVGLKKETAQLVAQLLERENWLTVISIVGIGGLGKTTLAKRVFNHDNVKAHFQCRAWVYVSQECRPKDILQGISREVITSPTKEQLQIIETAQEQELEEMLYEHLQKRRYFVVLDDIWSIEAWDVLAKAFPDTNNGSKLLLTTRNRDVALHADARRKPHELELLSENDSWELFLRKAFIDDQSFTRCPPELEEVARKIVGKCDGLPLAIVVIGGLLSRKRQVPDQWERVFNNIPTHFASGQHGVLPILALSYSDLPHYLKPCFLHLGHFPEDYVIRTRKLFHLWIAEGLIPQEEERMESTAEDYLNELTDRNMVQVVRMSADRRIKECQVHDVLRELSISKAKEEIFLEIHGEKDVVPSEKTRHQAIYSNFDRYVQLKPSIPRLRSLLFFYRDDWGSSEKFSQFICTSFKLLRVLDLQGIKVAYLSSEIGQLINLRYLGLCGSEITKLPSSIKYLRSLQTLDLSRGVTPSNVYNVICKMENLRHLYLSHDNRVGPLRTDKLRHLQTLSFVRVDDWEQKDTENLKSLLKLGVLVTEFSDTGKFFNSIAKLEHLLSLHMVFTDWLPSLTGLSHLQRLTKLRMEQLGWIRTESLEFPPNLTQLTLKSIGLGQRAMSALKELPKLSILKLRYFSYETEKLTISANEFTQLQFLEFDQLSGLIELMIGRDAMPRLRHCRIIKSPLTILCSGSVLSAFHEAEIQESRVQIIEASSRVDSPECSSGGSGVGDQ